MYLQYITDEEIVEFMKGYIYATHKNLHDVYTKLKTTVYDIERDGDIIKFASHIGDNVRSLTQYWYFTPYKTISKSEFGSTEMVDLLKLWSKFVYQTLKTKNADLAEIYKKSFIETIKTERNTKIAAAKEEYNELKL